MTKIEQKSIDSYCQENCKGFQETGKCFADGECKAKREAEQKPAWSEEDEELPKWSINNLTELKDRFGEEYGKVGKCIDWVKSLKNRVQPQPKQEWSEEDEQHIDSLLKRLDALCRNKFERTRFAISEDRDWLKSLRPQNKWKPTDEQIECLSDAIEHYNSLGYPASKLKELYEQLKKL